MTPLDSPTEWLAFAGFVGLILGLTIAGILLLAANARRRYDALNRGERPEDLP